MTTFLKRLAVYFIGVNVIDIIAEFFYSGNFESTVLSGNIRRIVFTLIGAIIVAAFSMVFDPIAKNQVDESPADQGT